MLNCTFIVLNDFCHAQKIYILHLFVCVRAFFFCCCVKLKTWHANFCTQKSIMYLILLSVHSKVSISKCFNSTAATTTTINSDRRRKEHDLLQKLQSIHLKKLINSRHTTSTLYIIFKKTSHTIAISPCPPGHLFNPLNMKWCCCCTFIYLSFAFLSSNKCQLVKSFILKNV